MRDVVENGGVDRADSSLGLAKFARRSVQGPGPAGAPRSPLFLRPPDSPDIVYEFFSPFAHVEGRYEWCRIRSPTHGVFDTFILLAETPPVVYVGSPAGERFMADRFPGCQTFPAAIRIQESEDGRTVKGRLKASTGPVRQASMVLAASKEAMPKNVPYGGEGKGIWGSPRFTCWGVDLVLPGHATGKLVWRDRPTVLLKQEPALVTLGSFGRIAPIAEAAVAKPIRAGPRRA